MPPVGLVAIVLLGIVLAYVVPQRMRERADYAMVRVEDRFSPEMRVVRSTAERAMQAPSADASGSREASGALLTTGKARASVAKLGEATMARPTAPLERAAVAARRQAHHVSSDMRAREARRSAMARRRGAVAVTTLLAAAAGWALYGATLVPLWVPVAASTAVVSVGIAGRRARLAQVRADQAASPVEREVLTAAAATSALQRLTRTRVGGELYAPTDAETEAIRVLTATDLAPGAVPASVPAPELPYEEDADWAPSAIPAPTYTLKARVAQRTPKPISDEDIAAGEAAAAQAGADSTRERTRVTDEAEPSTAALDAILARRGRQSA